MPDIAMCKGTDLQRSCPRLDRCHRYTATPTPMRQAYFMKLPLADDGSCSYFWDNADWGDALASTRTASKEG